MDMFDGVGRRQDRLTGSFLDIGQHSLNGRERDYLFRNDGDGTFVDVGYVNAADRIEDGRGLSVFDYDSDGQPDLLLRNYRQPAVLLHNRGGTRHWIEIALVGTRANRDAVGARVDIRVGERSLARVVEAGSSFLSAHSLVQHAGLGRATRVDSVVVRWPSGTQTELGPLDADRRYLVVEGAGLLP